MVARKNDADEASAVEAKKPTRTTRTPAAKTAAKKPAAKKPAAKKAPAKKTAAKPKSRTPLRKNMTKADREKQAALVASIQPEPSTLAEELGVSHQESLFVNFYITHFNGRRAYEEAGYAATSPNAMYVAACKLLRKPNIAEYLRRRVQEMTARVEDEQNKLISVLTYTAYADHNELIENRIDCCRFCYGDDHKYQFTPQEYERYKENHAEEVELAKSTGQTPPEFDPKGGIGFNPNLEPYHDCPECFGRGRECVVVKDTRYLSPAAAALYAGVKTTKDGIEIKTNDQAKARETLAKIHKLYDESTKVNVSFDPDELEARFGKNMDSARNRTKEMLEDRRKAREERGDN